MRIRITALSSLAAAVGLCLAHAGSTSAATLSYEETAAGVTGRGIGTDYSHLPVTDIYANLFGPLTTDLAAAPGFNFYDDFNFTVANSTIDAVTATIDLGKLFSIKNLEVRLYNATGNPATPVIGAPAGLLGGGWSPGVDFTVGGLSGTFDVLPMTMLTGGSYVLQVRGEVAGTAGGSYAGTLNLSPVPLPAALPLMLSGLGLLGGMVRKRFAR
jgi:hypothetical protein